MSTVLAQHFSHGPRPGLPGYLGRVLALRALLLLVVFVLAGGGRALDQDED